VISGQRVIGEPIVAGLVLNDSLLWHPDFAIASKQVHLLIFVSLLLKL